MSRFARKRRVIFYEEPIFEDVEPHIRSSVCPQSGVRIETPVLPNGLTPSQVNTAQRELLQSILEKNQVNKYIAWYYTPMAMQFTGSLDPSLTVYDCMDELSAFAGAPLSMRLNEEALFRAADLVFTGGASLFESKRKQHKSVHAFPSSVDKEHFAKARRIQNEPADQINIPKPRIGFAGVIDERMDLQLLRQAAQSRPDWQFVMLGPVAKVDPSHLPQAPNIHWLGMKKYDDLPAYFSGWDIGMLPFALNESTRFISPTKTPEYLAAGLPVISTRIRDVVTPYGDSGFASIVDGPEQFVSAAETLLTRYKDPFLRERIDHHLSQSSWDKTWNEMEKLMNERLSLKQAPEKKQSSRISKQHVTSKESVRNV